MPIRRTYRSTYKSAKRRDFVPLLDWLDAVPPWKCRAAAVKKDLRTRQTIRIPAVELSQMSGIPLRTISRISYLKSWDSVSIKVASAFAFACGVNLITSHPLEQYVRVRFKKGLPFFMKKQRDAMDRAARR